MYNFIFEKKKCKNYYNIFLIEQINNYYNRVFVNNLNRYKFKKIYFISYFFINYKLLVSIIILKI